MQIITKKFLDQFNVAVGAEIVLYDVAGRKIYFFHKGPDDYRLKMVRGKRRLPIKVRKSDFRVRLNADGSVTFGDVIKELQT